MYNIDQTWAMVELHNQYKGKDIKGQLWWNGQGDKLFKDGATSQWYKINNCNEKTGIEKVIYDMSKISNRDVKIDIPGFE